jgi:hypothetical protein
MYLYCNDRAHASVIVKLFLSSAKSSPPGVPEAVNIGKTFADLKWEPPKHDGGAKITGKPRDTAD